jgi:hypothetical protein
MFGYSCIMNIINKLFYFLFVAEQEYMFRLYVFLNYRCTDLPPPPITMDKGENTYVLQNGICLPEGFLQNLHTTFNISL